MLKHFSSYNFHWQNNFLKGKFERTYSLMFTHVKPCNFTEQWLYLYHSATFIAPWNLAILFTEHLICYFGIGKVGIQMFVMGIIITCGKWKWKCSYLAFKSESPSLIQLCYCIIMIYSCVSGVMSQNAEKVLSWASQRFLFLRQVFWGLQRL